MGHATRFDGLSGRGHWAAPLWGRLRTAMGDDVVFFAYNRTTGEPIGWPSDQGTPEEHSAESVSLHLAFRLSSLAHAREKGLRWLILGKQLFLRPDLEVERARHFAWQRENAESTVPPGHGYVVVLEVNPRWLRASDVKFFADGDVRHVRVTERSYQSMIDHLIKSKLMTVSMDGRQEWTDEDPLTWGETQ